MSIPKKLLSETSSLPFDDCSVCNEKLNSKMYFVEKAYHRNLGDNEHAVIFEYAICESCKRDMMKEISTESMLRIQAFMMEHEDDLNEMMDYGFDLEHCSFTQIPIEDMNEYHVVGVIKNNELQVNPMVFGPRIMESYQELLSEKTKGYFENFYDDFIDIPPELAKILSDKVKPVML